MHWMILRGMSRLLAVHSLAGSAGYDLCMELYSYAYNLSSDDYDCYAKFLSNDDGVNQSLCIFWDEPAPVYYNGNFRFRKYSSNDSISNNNNCYSLQGAV